MAEPLDAAPQAGLIERVLARDPRAVARAISLIENESSDAAALIARIYPRTGQAYLIGVTGPRRDDWDSAGRRDPRYYPPRPPADAGEQHPGMANYPSDPGYRRASRSNPTPSANRWLPPLDEPRYPENTVSLSSSVPDVWIAAQPARLRSILGFTN